MSLQFKKEFPKQTATLYAWVHEENGLWLSPSGWSQHLKDAIMYDSQLAALTHCLEHNTTPPNARLVCLTISPKTEYESGDYNNPFFVEAEIALVNPIVRNANR